MKKDIRLAALFIFSTLLISCAYNPFSSNNHTTGSPTATVIGAAAGAGSVAALGGSKPFIALGGLGGGMFGYYITTLRHDAGGIIRVGGEVYTVGDVVGIYIPSDRLFEPNTADLLPQACLPLNSAVKVLQRYPNNNIIVSGSTSGFFRDRWEQKLSEKRAQVVSGYLWDAGINDYKERSLDYRKLNYVGYGDYFPIANTYTNKGIRANSRIQIISYPDNCDLILDKLKMSMHNMGAMTDQAVYEAPDVVCRRVDRNGNCIGIDP